MKNIFKDLENLSSESLISAIGKYIDECGDKLDQEDYKFLSNMYTYAVKDLISNSCVCKQILFKDIENDVTHIGILTNTGDVICGCCGSIISSDDLDEIRIIEIYDGWSIDLDEYNELLCKYNRLCTKDKSPSVEDINDILNLGIESLDIPYRVFNSLRRAGFNTINDIMNTKPYELLKLRNFGKKSLKEVENGLSKYGLTL
jgi:hypothetical protein